MCNSHDANTHEKLAKINVEKGNIQKAHTHLLEAASIYTLIAAQEKNTIMHQKANQCYTQAHQLIGIEKQTLSIPELAHATLHELDAINKEKANHLRTHNHPTPHGHQTPHHH